MGKKLLFAAAFLIGAFAAVLAMQPSQFRIARSTKIQAPPEAVFAMVNDFHRWGQWSPWEKLDPAMKKTYSGSESGAGAVYEWAGNKDVGKGKMTLEESQPNERIGIRLEFIEPFVSTSKTTFRFQPAGLGTEVTWEMSGENGFMEKAFGLLMNMDKMVGGDFERGLSNMKSAVESGR